MTSYPHQAPSTKHQAPSTKHQAPSTKHQAPSTKHQYFTIFHRLTFAILCARKATSKTGKTRVSIKPAFSATYPLPESSAAVFGDVTSANIVGYQGVKLPEGRQMTCATFKNMTDTGMWLSDLMVIGYKNGMAEEFINEEGTGSFFSFQILNSTGGLVKEYYWKETLDDPWGEPTWAGDGCWKDQDGVVVQGHNKDTDVWLDKGSAVWFLAPEIFEGLETDGYALQNSGEVMALSQSVPMRNDGRMAIGNLFPVDCWLSKMSITGYHDCTEMDDFINEEGTGSFFSFQLLDDVGGLKAEYYWKETLDDPWGEPTWAGDGCWKDQDGNVIQGEDPETDVLIKSGTGMWTLAPDFWGSDGYYMVFPGLNL